MDKNKTILDSLAEDAIVVTSYKTREDFIVWLLSQGIITELGNGKDEIRSRIIVGKIFGKYISDDEVLVKYSF